MYNSINPDCLFEVACTKKIVELFFNVRMDIQTKS